MRVINQLIAFDYLVSFDPMELSSNKKSAFDWLLTNKKLNTIEKNLMKERFMIDIKQMQKMNETITI